MNRLRETMACVQHEIWSHWMEYLFNESAYNDDGSVTIPPDKVTRWAEQLKTHYFWLTEEEKESDRHQADRIIAELKSTVAALDLAAQILAAADRIGFVTWMQAQGPGSDVRDELRKALEELDGH